MPLPAGETSAHSPSPTIGRSRDRDSVAPAAVDAVAPHHGLSVWAALAMATGAALLVTSVLVVPRGGFDASQGTTSSLVSPPPSPSPAAGESDPPAVDTAIHEQFIQLDEVFVTVDVEQIGAPENLPGEEPIVR